jgi:hypothetical protein
MELNNETVIDAAVTNSSIKFLKFIWELCFDIEKEEKTKQSYNHLSVKSFRTNYKTVSEMSKEKTSSKKNIYGAVSMNKNNNFNQGNTPFMLSNLVEKFALAKKYEEIHEIIEWKNLSVDNDLLQRLFDNNCFNEISLLLSKTKKIRWLLTKDMFRSVIENEELDLILFFLTKPEVNSLIKDPLIQKKIVDKYIKYIIFIKFF